MYNVTRFVSYLVRNIILNNPLEPFDIDGIISLVIIKVLIIPISYNMVGWVYEKGSCKPLGSALFMISYIFNSWIIEQISRTYQHILLMIILYILYFGFVVYISLKCKNNSV